MWKRALCICLVLLGVVGCTEKDEVWVELHCRCNLATGLAAPVPTNGMRANTFQREWIGCRAACDQTVAAMGLHRLEIQ